MKLIKLLWIYALVSLSGSLMGQVGSSPFSLNGIGLIESLAQANQFGMAGVGIASPTRFHINNLNPALLKYNRMSSFQMGVSVDYRNSATETLSSTNGGATLRNLVFSFPVVKDKWSMSFGLMPFSNVNYDIQLSESVEGTPIPLTTDFEGEGGLVQAYFANGVEVAKGLNIGIRGSYIFGSIDDISRSFVGYSRADLLELIEQDLDTLFFSDYVTSYTRQNTFGDVTMGFGVHYRYQQSDDKFFNVGFTYDPRTNIKGTTTTFLSRRDLGNQLVNGTDTTRFEEPGSFRLPNRFGFGLAYEKFLNLMIGLDVTYQLWSEAREINGNSEGFKDAFKIALGAEFIPDVNSIDTYFERVSYRLGLSIERLPYEISGTAVNDIGINFGGSFPVGQGSTFDVGFRFGQRGNLDDNPLRERYMQALVGITINDRWFVRRRFD